MTATRAKTPTATRPPGLECSYYKMDVQDLWGTGMVGNNNFEDLFKLNANGPSCLMTLLTDVYKECEKKKINNRVYIDDCVKKELYKEDGLFADTSLQGEFLNNEYGRSWYYAQYFDENCNKMILPTRDRDKVCNVGTFLYKASPISLLMEGGMAEFNSNHKPVKFSLKPGEDNYADWRASNTAPLLVYDPEHSGKVLSYMQLFGNWAFGGKFTAYQTTLKSDYQEGMSPWEDGFSALAVLDTNLDNEISGVELDSLALWFDINQNAESESGEVRSVKDVGIVKLFFEGAYLDKLTGDRILNVGYELNKDGQTKVGTSVDWYAASAKSLIELSQRTMALDQFCGLDNKVKKSGDEFSDTAVINVADPGYSGTWIWESFGVGAKDKSGGIIVFSTNNKGKYDGISLFQMSLDAGKLLNVKKVVMFFGLTGQLTKDEKNSPSQMTFSHVNEDGSRQNSIVTLSEDSNKLEGNTWITAGQGNDNNVVMQYPWRAVRYSRP